MYSKINEDKKEERVGENTKRRDEDYEGKEGKGPKGKYTYICTYMYVHREEGHTMREAETTPACCSCTAG